jgi:hypothetical protein
MRRVLQDTRFNNESWRYQSFECVAWVIARVYFKRSAEDFDAR